MQTLFQSNTENQVVGGKAMKYGSQCKFYHLKINGQDNYRIMNG